MVSNVIESQYRGSFMSLNSSFQQLFIGTASFIAGLIVTDDAYGKINHYDWAGYFSIAILLFCIYLGYLLKKISKTPL
jgi:predicted MFS family arabinose efflux permease